MGTRIASIWVKDDDKNPGQKKRTGVMKADAGINIPAGVEIGVSIVANKDKTDSRHPDLYIEVWPMRDRTGGDQGQSGPGDF